MTSYKNMVRCRIRCYLFWLSAITSKMSFLSANITSQLRLVLVFALSSSIAFDKLSLLRRWPIRSLLSRSVIRLLTFRPRCLTLASFSHMHRTNRLGYFKALSFKFQVMSHIIKCFDVLIMCQVLTHHLL